MTGLSARRSSVCNSLSSPGEGELHLWFDRQGVFSGSEPFARAVLSRYAGVAPTELQFTKGPNGKPELSSPRLPIAFNLSNSRDHRVLAVSAGGAVGVDLEYCDRQRDVEKLARRWFSVAESRQLRARAGLSQVYRFYGYWTLKEAAIKAMGGSLGRELENNSFELTEPYDHADEHTPGSITALTSTVPAPSWYGLLQPFDDYRLAICCLAPQDFSAGIWQFDWPQKTPETHPIKLLAVSTVDRGTTEVASL